jgi:S-(hydroxymethyl)glutathione dehydrogenase/alcohol dehydrogenase
MTNTAALVTGFSEPMQYVDLTLRDPGPNEVLVHLDYAAVCITDAYAWRGGSTRSEPPFVTGHAATGIVVEAGAGVTKVSVGDRVSVTGTTECGVCHYCLRGVPGACAEVFEQGVRMIGRTPDGVDVRVEGGIGAYLQYNIYREGTVVRLTDDVDPVQAALFGCGISSGLGAVLSVAEVQVGASVAISGAGHLGLWMLQGAKIAGAEQIIVVEPIAERRALAEQLGATHVIDPADGDPIAQVKALTPRNRGVDYSFEAAGNGGAIEQAFAMTANGGTMVPTGMRSRTETLTLNVLDFAIRAKQVKSSQTGGAWIHRDIPRWERLLNSGRIDASPIISGVYPLTQLDDVFQKALNREVITAVMDLR